MTTDRESATVDAVADFRAIGLVLCLRVTDAPEEWWIGEAWLGETLLWSARLCALRDLNPAGAMEYAEAEFAGILKDMIAAHMGT